MPHAKVILGLGVLSTEALINTVKSFVTIASGLCASEK
jgi:hypothetical protein